MTPIRGTANRSIVRDVDRRYIDALWTSAVAGCFRATRDGDVIDANPAALVMLGMSGADDARGLHLAELFVHSADVDRLWPAAGHRSGSPLEAEMRRRDGTTVWVSVEPWRRPDVGDEYFGILVDVSDRHRVTEQLRRRVERLALVLDFSRLAVGRGTSEELISAACRAAAAMTSSEFATVLRCDAPSRRVSVAAACGVEWSSADRLDLVVSADADLEQLLRTRAITDVECSPAPIAHHPALDRYGARSYASVAVRAHGPPFGAICVGRRDPHVWDHEDLESLQLLTDLLAVALQRASADDQRQALLGRLARAQEEERLVIAGEIHDDAVQVMTAASMRLQLLRGRLVDARDIEAAGKLQETIEISIGRLRSLLFDLTPPDIQHHGLAAAVRALLERLAPDGVIRWSFDDQLHTEPDDALRIILFRICQEALTNVRKHAAAGHVTVRLDEREGGCHISIHDDGRGFHVDDASREPIHLGLISMRERAAAAGGRVVVSSSPGRGTDVDAWLPMRASA